ncbi:response regulator transcription factor [uncultured Lentibacter sp.]|jgi:two-component system nitrate/nitrite response regulator NarP|uniref:response regulator transcription factor n=1 Tax=uncultured Lentibacter sp. TaxID=1659309 RepID=UPI00260E5EA2|nr:response regulator transcription factor [uncultured Lentibacter sp.]
MYKVKSNSDGADSGRELSVLIADDHELVRDAVAMALRADAALTVDIVQNLQDTLAYLEEKGPVDVLLLDLVMPDMNGLASIETVVEKNKGGAVVVFSGNVSAGYLQQAIDMGCFGIIPKTLPLKSLANAIKLVASGEVFVPFSLSASFEEAAAENAGPLKARELTILRHVSNGLTNKEIAWKLNMSEVGVKSNMRTICTKLEAKNRASAVMNAKNLGLI